MKRLRPLLVFSLSLLVMTTAVLAHEFSDTLAPYPVQEHGRRVEFAELTKQDLGKRCSVYLKPGRSCEREDDSNNPDGVFVHPPGRTIVNGEFSELGKKHLVLVWAPSDNSAYFYPIPEDDIDYIVFESR